MLRAEGRTGAFERIQREVRRLIRVFDEKPFVVTCRGDGCDSDATRGSLSQGGVRPIWWCEDCDPSEFGASPSKLYMVESFADAVDYISVWCGDNREPLRILIRELAQAKGLPARVGEQQARMFFA